MSFFGKPFAVAVSAVALSGAALAPLGLALSAGAAQAQPLPEATQAVGQVAAAPAPLSPPATPRATQALVVEQPGNAGDADQIRNGGLRDVIDRSPTDAPARSRAVDAELT